MDGEHEGRVSCSGSTSKGVHSHSGFVGVAGRDRSSLIWLELGSDSKSASKAVLDSRHAWSLAGSSFPLLSRQEKKTVLQMRESHAVDPFSPLNFAAVEEKK